MSDYVANSSAATEPVYVRQNMSTTTSTRLYDNPCYAVSEPPLEKVKVVLGHTVHLWKDKETHQYITTRVNLPSGLDLKNLNDVLECTVSEDGHILSIVFEMPNILYNSSTVERGWLRVKLTNIITELVRGSLVMQILGENKDDKMKLNVTHNKKIEGICTIPLEYECEKK